ncbi:MAG: sulfatase, partial [Myxococcales bacterium]|nr:sulfatase [Myxococcales bacterium]
HTNFGGYSRPVTPNLAAWAKGATVFESAFSVSSSTRLTFPALVAGQFNATVPMVNGPRHPYRYQDSVTTLAKVLAKRGYDTVHVIGDDYFDTGRWGGYWGGFKKVDHKAYEKAKDPEHTSPEITAVAIEEVKAKRKKPLFLWVHYYDVHGPYRRPAEVEAFGSESVDRYDSELVFLDRQIGLLLKEVAVKWPREERVVALTADHGEAFDRKHPRKHHDFTLDHTVLHIPFVIDAPWPAGSGKREKGLASQLDLVPTLANLAGAKPQKEWGGESLVPVLAEAEAKPEKKVLYSLFYIPEDRKKNKDPFRMVGVRTDDHYFVVDYRRNRRHLSQWRQDPLADHDLSASEPNAATVLSYLAALKLEWFREKEEALYRRPAPRKPARKK